jgi:hypothetical protein
MASDMSTDTSFVWTSLTLAENLFRWRNTTIDFWSNSYCLTYGLNKWNRYETIMEPKNGLFLHVWLSDPKAIIIHNRHKMSLLCPCKNYLVIIVRTGRAILRWRTLSFEIIATCRKLFEWFLWLNKEHLLLSCNSKRRKMKSYEFEMCPPSAALLLLIRHSSQEVRWISTKQNVMGVQWNPDKLLLSL